MDILQKWSVHIVHIAQRTHIAQSLTYFFLRIFTCFPFLQYFLMERGTKEKRALPIQVFIFSSQGLG